MDYQFKYIKKQLNLNELTNFWFDNPKVWFNCTKEDDNFIKTELVNLEKNKIASGIRENGISLLSEILSKHFTEINEKIHNLELKLNNLNELNGLD